MSFYMQVNLPISRMNQKNLEILSNVVDEIFFGSILEPLRGLFEKIAQLRRRRFHISYIRRYWAVRDSSGDLLDTIYKLHSFNNLS